MTHKLVMYTRTSSCPFVTLAKRVLAEHAVPYHEIFTDRDEEARQRVMAWTGFLSVPTLIVAEEDSVLPYEEPAPLARGTSPRGVDRGTMITEPGMPELTRWLVRNGFVSETVGAD
jgi:glutaredoxin